MSIKDVSTEELERELERRKKPKPSPPCPIDQPNFSALALIVSDYVAFTASDDYHEDSDFKQYIYETVMEAYYGKDFWNWLRTR